MAENKGDLFRKLLRGRQFHRLERGLNETTRDNSMRNFQTKDYCGSIKCMYNSTVKG